MGRLQSRKNKLALAIRLFLRFVSFKTKGGIINRKANKKRVQTKFEGKNKKILYKDKENMIQ